MITKNRTGKFGFLKYSAGIVVALAITILFACEKKVKVEESEIISELAKPKIESLIHEEVTTDTTVFIIVEDPAVFQDDKGNSGDLNGFRNWVQQNLKYPEAAAKNGIQGKVYVQFVINTTGEIVAVKVLRGVDPILDNEAIRVISSSPKWKPAKQSGKVVKQQFVIPLTFALQ